MSTRFFVLPLLLLGLSSSGCLRPKFSPYVAHSFASDEMRLAETESLELYYPAEHQEAAFRTAAKLEECYQRLRALATRKGDAQRLVVVLTSSELNAAFVRPDLAGIHQHMLMPIHRSLESFNLSNMGTGEMGALSCHEAVHYVQFTQNGAFWDWVNTLGGSLGTPQFFTGLWFMEGLASYYENKLEEGFGKPASPYFRGRFWAGVASRGGRVSASDLAPQKREIPSAHYLVGMHFVEYLATTYGEQKLWELIDVQGRSVLAPFGVTLRFKAVFGKGLGALLDEYSAHLQARHVERQRPPTQKVLDGTKYSEARMAVSRQGVMALLHEQLDDISRLTVREPDGSLRFTQAMNEVLPGRRAYEFSPSLVSGMDFTADGRWLFFVAADQSPDSGYTARLWKVDARDGTVVRTWEKLPGLGGTIDPGGQSYVYVHLEGDSANLVRMNLETQERTVLTRFTGASSLGAPAFSPDGTRIVFSRRSRAGWDLFLLEEGGDMRQLTQDGRFNYSPRWLDAHRLVFVREHEARAQVHTLDTRTGEVTRASDVPYLAHDPAPLGSGAIAFLNREAWHWTVDTLPLPPATEPASGAALLTAMLSPMPEAPAPALNLQRDEPYSAFRHLWVPQLHLPWLAVLPNEDGRWNRVLGYVGVGGGDRLGYHAYLLTGTIDTHSEEPSWGVSAGYGNHLLAPWFIQLQGSLDRVDDTTDIQSELSASRNIGTHSASLSLRYLERRQSETSVLGSPRARFLGPSLGYSYAGSASSLEGGIQRGLFIDVEGQYFPSMLKDAPHMGDVRLAVTGYLPLPLSGRHRLRLGARGRLLPGAPQGLLRVGGSTQGLLLHSMGRGRQPDESSPLLLPSGLAFTEYLRGYEDISLVGTGVAIAGASYQYSFILDKGSASTLYILPSLFIRQIDVEGFAEGAYLRGVDTSLHRAAGGAVHLRMLVEHLLPLSLSYELAHRFDGRGGLLHQVLLRLEAVSI